MYLNVIVRFPYPLNITSVFLPFGGLVIAIKFNVYLPTYVSTNWITLIKKKYPFN